MTAKVKQPIFGCNNISGEVILNGCSSTFKIKFLDGGVDRVGPLFTALLQLNGEAVTAAGLSALYLSLPATLSDPSFIYREQPVDISSIPVALPVTMPAASGAGERGGWTARCATVAVCS